MLVAQLRQFWVLFELFWVILCFVTPGNRDISSVQCLYVHCSVEKAPVTTSSRDLLCVWPMMDTFCTTRRTVSRAYLVPTQVAPVRQPAHLAVTRRDGLRRRGILYVHLVTLKND